MIHKDSGCSISDCINSINKYGTCDEFNWPYDVTKYDVKPYGYCYKLKNKDLNIDFLKIDQKINSLK